MDQSNVTDIKEGMAFAAGFANALIKLKEAMRTNVPASITPPEAKAIIDALNLMRKEHNGQKR